MQAPGDPDEDRREGFDHGGWHIPYSDEVAGSVISDGFPLRAACCWAERTYEIFAAFWPTQPAEDPFAAMLNSLPKYVVSTTLEEPLSWRNSTLIKGNVAEEVAKLKEKPGKDLQVIGSGELAQTLIRHDLVDQYQLMVHPVILGSGKRLFRDRSNKTDSAC